MMSVKPTKSKSTSRGLSSKGDLEGHLFLQKTLSSNSRDEPKRVNSISIVTKNTLSKELFRENKENHNLEKDFAGIVNNSEYIKSLYKKYLGKDSEVDKQKTMKTIESSSVLKQMRDSSVIYNGPTKLNSFRESAQKPPVRSQSKRDTISAEKETKSQDLELRQLLELCDMEDSCVRAVVVLRQARKRANTLSPY